MTSKFAKKFANVVATIGVLYIAFVLLLASTTQTNATFQIQGTLPCASLPAHTGDVTSGAGSCANAIASGAIVNADFASGAYVKGVFRAFCTGTVTSSVTNFTFAGMGGKVTACADSTGTTAAGGLKIPTAGTIRNLFVNLSAGGKSTSKVTMLKNGSATGAPTCTYGTGTTCNDVATALAVAAGDIITVNYTSGASDGSANLSVSFELWN